MIDPKAITTYAQYNEDIILLALFKGVSKGFYVDVGANYPVIDSVTKLFYDRGWRGINIEPIKSLHKQLQEARPEDINLNYGIGEKSGKDKLREFIKLPGHSTFSSSQKEHESSKEYKDYKVSIKPIKDILKEQKATHIHFLKIDVEGFEYEAIAGNDWQQFRPEVICIEANSKPKQDWRPILKDNNYNLFISDGLNEYYIAKEAVKRTKDFTERVVELDYHALKQHQAQSWQADSQELVRLTQIIKAQDTQLKAVLADNEKMRSETNELANLSLANQPFKVRVKRAAIGLTVDWRQYKKKTKNP